LELRRGGTHESAHFGVIAVVDSTGKLIASYGEPESISFLRSTAKPFQALPLIETGGHKYWNLSAPEIALICASHSGSDEHIAIVNKILAQLEVAESELLCGTHPPIDESTHKALLKRGEDPSPIRHNCSGKHTGMLALARYLGLPTADYINPEHAIQKKMLRAFADMCVVEPRSIKVGTDGCSAPNFAIPLQNVALGYARLCHPHGLPPKRAQACQTITAAMTAHPKMVAGEGRFDTHLMEVAQGKIISKSGAEGYLGIGIMPGTIGPNAPGVGIAIKISDGDPKGRVRPAVAVEVLRQLGALTPQQLAALSSYGPKQEVKNWRDLVVGDARPVFTLNREKRR
jgi:L-asparaginase II